LIAALGERDRAAAAASCEHSANSTPMRRRQRLCGRLGSVRRATSCAPKSSRRCPGSAPPARRVLVCRACASNRSGTRPRRGLAGLFSHSSSLFTPLIFPFHLT
jgi:hypothetical protein